MRRLARPRHRRRQLRIAIAFAATVAAAVLGILAYLLLAKSPARVGGGENRSFPAVNRSPKHDYAGSRVSVSYRLKRQDPFDRTGTSDAANVTRLRSGDVIGHLDGALTGFNADIE